jgi:glycosyltransferase involved in cell wall biosynthesis
LTPGTAPRRILVAVGSLEVGGAERQIVEIARLLQGPEFEFRVVTTAGGGPLEEPLRRTGAAMQALSPAGSALPASKAQRGRRAVRNALRLREVIRAWRPDVLHAYMTETSAVAAAARWPHRRPFFIFSKRSLVRWIARDRIYYPLVRWTNARCDLILANSNAVRDEAIAKEGAPAERIRVVYNGVDTDLYAPGPRPQALARELGIPEGATVVGMVANLHLYKGHLEVLTALSRIGPPNGVSILFVGREGNASEAVREAVSRLGMSGRVVFAGARSDIPEVLRLIDVFVSASHEEGLSNSILEAMAAARPIVATTVGGSVEQIVPEVSGLLVPSHDAAAIETALRRMIAEPALRARLGAAARERALEVFSLDRLKRSMADIYGNATS